MQRFFRFLAGFVGLRRFDRFGRRGRVGAFGSSRQARRSGRFERSGTPGLFGFGQRFGAFWQGFSTQRRRTGRGPSMTGPRPVPRRIDERASRRAFGIVCAFLGLGFALWVLFAPGAGVLSYFQARGELAEMQRKSEDLARENTDLRGEIDRLKTDEAYVEQVARNKYGLLKKDERVYNFPPKNKKDR